MNFMITLRQRVFIIVSVVLAIVLAILLYLLYGKKPTTNTTTNTTGPVTSSTVTVTTPAQGTDTAPVNTLPTYSEDIYIKQQAKIFVERFGSNSTQNPNQNIEDSLVLTTPSMQTWLKKQMTEASRDYVGQVTEVLASKISDKTVTNATVHIEVQQTIETKKDGAVGATSKEVKQRKGRVTLVKSGNDWLIDGLYWE